MRRTTSYVSLAAVAALVAGGVVMPTARADQDPLSQVVDRGATAAGVCDDLDTRSCLLPFPNDQFTVLDSSTPTGRRIDLSPMATPRNIAGKPMDPTEWNRNDGFSPGSMILTHVPGLDLTTTFGLDPEPETGPGADPFVDRDEIPDAVIEAPELSVAPDAPIVLLDADTGERHPYWAELDQHPVTVETGADRTLIIRPLTNFEEGHRYIVALRDLRDGAGTELPAPAAFAALRDGYDPPRGRRFPRPADIDPADRAARYDDIFTRLRSSGVAVDDLHLAWDFHVASGQNLAGRALAIRDDAFAQLGDTDLADLEVEGDAPPMTITEVVDAESDGHPTRTVHGTVTVPNYLTTPQESIEVPLIEDVPPIAVPQTRLHYATPAPGPMDVPVQNPLIPTIDVDFTCKFRTDVGATKPTLYGHGLLGGRGEVEGGSTDSLRGDGHAMCAADWIGMATEDIVNVGLILHDIGFFPSLADRAQQGFLNFMYLGRALIHPDGAVAKAAFQDTAGEPLLDIDELFFNGNSQGGIMGGALTALAPDFTKAVLGVPAMNYSTLLNRSVDWEGEFIDLEDPGIPAYGSFNYNAYPDKVQQQLVFALLQMLWDRGEANGYAHHMTTDPYPNTPAHQVLLEVAFGDYQVSNHAAEVEARTIGADYLGSALAPGRHWGRAVATGEARSPFGLEPFTERGRHPAFARSGSAIVYWDSGNPTPPNGNVTPPDLDQDPHGDPRSDPDALTQKRRFYATGAIVDVSEGQPNWTQDCPRHADHDPGC